MIVKMNLNVKVRVWTSSKVDNLIARARSEKLNVTCFIIYGITQIAIDFFKENCSAGCPCDEWDCEDQTTTTSEVLTTALPEKSVLVLSNTNSRSVPMVVSFDGEVDNDIEFDYNEFVGYGCSTTLNGEFYYVGGGNDNKQVSFPVNSSSRKINSG